MSDKFESQVSSRRQFMKFGAASALTLSCVPRLALSGDASSADSRCVLRVAIMSDVHFPGTTTAKEYKRFRRAVEVSYEYAAKQKSYDRLDALMVVGDMSDHGVVEEIGLFKRTMDELVHGDTKTLLCMGNHEFYGGNHDVWRQTFGVEPNARYEVNGFQFIALSPEKGTMRDGDYLYALDWFRRELAAATEATPDKPVFVFQHYPVSPTVYGGRGLDDWGLEDLFDTLQQYPNVVDFSGHTHYPMTDPRVAWQGNFTAFGTSTLSYLCHGGEGGRYEKYPADSGNYAEFYIMEVYEDNSLTLFPYNVAKDEFYEFCYRAVPGKTDTYRYTDARYFQSERPVWPADAELKTTLVRDDGIELEIPQASSPDVVHSYRVDVERRNSEGVFVPDAPQFFWAHYYDRPVPEKIVADIRDLDPETTYRAEVRALNPFMRVSEESLKIEFTTAPDPDGAIDRRAERPEANVLDVRVVDGKLVNAPTNGRESQIPLEVHGSVPLSGGAATFSGKEGNFVKLPCSEEDYRRLRRATIMARFKVDGSRKNSVGAVFGNTELCGIELSVNYEEKTLKFWATVGERGYTIASAPIEFDQWIDAAGVCDGKTQILYVNGKEVGRIDVSGALRHPSDAVVRAFCFGADIAPGGGGSDFFSGQIERARLYNWALTPEQVAALSKNDEE